MMNTVTCDWPDLTQLLTSSRYWTAVCYCQFLHLYVSVLLTATSLTLTPVNLK